MSGDRLQAVVWAVMIGVLTFAAIELLVVGGLLSPPKLYLVWGAGAVVPVVVYLFAHSVAQGGGGVMARIHQPKSGVPSPVRQYSQAAALAARGQHRRAVQLYEQGLASHPEDFEPYLRIARIHRDKLNHLELAVRWYERARREVRLSQAQEFLVANELVDIYRNRLHAPQRAVVELERLVTRFPRHPSAVSVEKELRRLREDVRPPRS